MVFQFYVMQSTTFNKTHVAFTSSYSIRKYDFEKNAMNPIFLHSAWKIEMPRSKIALSKYIY